MKYRYREDIEMKDSGIEWIGKIPKDWTHKKVRNLGDISTSSVDKKINEDEQMIKLVNYVDVYNSKTKELFNHENYMNVSAKQNQISSSNLIRGDVLFTPSSETIHDIGYSVVVMENLENTLYSYHIVRLRFKEEVDLNFKKYMFWSNSFLKYLSSRATGTTRKTLSINNFKDNSIVMPKLNEQKKIGKFLDEKTSQFDSIISKKEALIKKLEEAKKSLISEVVTGKVKVVKNNDGYELVKRSRDEMKDSGVEWVKEIPNHWEVINGKWLFAQRKDRAKADDEQLTASQKYGVILQKDFMKLENQKVVLVEKDFSILKHVEPKDFVISMRSFQGGLEYSNIKGCISSAYVMLIPNEKVYSPFFRWFFKSSKYINALQSTSNLIRDGQAMRYSNFTQVPLFIFSKEEQKRISNYLDNTIGKIDTLISKTKIQIEKLKEAKLSLISEAVTGKIEILD